MSMILLTIMMAQAVKVADPAPAAKPKPKQVCEYIEITGSRAKRRVCADANGIIDGPIGLSNGAPNSGLLYPARPEYTMPGGPFVPGGGPGGGLPNQRGTGGGPGGS